MAVQAKVLIPAKSAENSQTTQYTSTGVTTIIDAFTGTNYSASAASLSINLVPSGGSPANSNLIVKTKTLQPGETYRFPEIIGHVLTDGCYISTIASAATSITIRSSGRQIS